MLRACTPSGITRPCPRKTLLGWPRDFMRSASFFRRSSMMASKSSWMIKAQTGNTQKNFPPTFTSNPLDVTKISWDSHTVWNNQANQETGSSTFNRGEKEKLGFLQHFATKATRTLLQTSRNMVLHYGKTEFLGPLRFSAALPGDK